MAEFYLLTTQSTSSHAFRHARKKELKKSFDKNRTHDFRTTSSMLCARLPTRRTHLEGRRSVELMKLSLKPVRASRVEEFQGP